MNKCAAGGEGGGAHGSRKDVRASGGPAPHAVSGSEARLWALVCRWAGLKQFMLVGATMPNAGTKNVPLHVERSWPVSERKAERPSLFGASSPLHRLGACLQAAAWVRTGREHTWYDNTH